MPYYVYVFLDAKNRPYYVGKTSDLKRRRKEHMEEIRKGNTLPKYNKARLMIKNKVGLKMRSVRRVYDEREAYRLERYYIRRYRKEGYILMNLTSGGPKEIPIEINKPTKENQNGLKFRKLRKRTKYKRSRRR
jgi:predicted GIY-YIG superfamily endonuclease